MLDVVFVIGLAGDDDFPFGVGIVGRNVAKFSGSLAECSHPDHGFVPASINSDVKEFVLLFINQIVLVCAQHMAKHFVVALGDGIFGYIENRFVVGGPRHVINAFDFLGQQFTGNQVLDLQGVLSITSVVGRVGQQRAVLTGRKAADGHELLSLGHLV